jgi:hypothetical protein
MKFSWKKLSFYITIGLLCGVLVSLKENLEDVNAHFKTQLKNLRKQQGNIRRQIKTLRQTKNQIVQRLNKFSQFEKYYISEKERAEILSYLKKEKILRKENLLGNLEIVELNLKNAEELENLIKHIERFKNRIGISLRRLSVEPERFEVDLELFFIVKEVSKRVK